MYSGAIHLWSSQEGSKQYKTWMGKSEKTVASYYNRFFFSPSRYYPVLGWKVSGVFSLNKLTLSIWFIYQQFKTSWTPTSVIGLVVLSVFLSCRVPIELSLPVWEPLYQNYWACLKISFILMHVQIVGLTNSANFGMGPVVISINLEE